MTPRRTGLCASIIAASGLFAIGQLLDVTPGRPMATRTDVFFQSDAGGIVHDATIDFNERARGVHPAIYPLWTAPLHRLAGALAPGVPVEVTATYASRALVNTVSGAGIGYLFSVLRRRGFSLGHLGIMLVLLLTASGNALAAIPDHFGLSLGILTAAFGVYWHPGSPRRRALRLLVLTAVAGSVTITNVAFPLLLLLAMAIREFSIPRWCYVASLAVLAGVCGFGAWFYTTRPDIQTRVDERIGLYLTWTLTRHPETALTMACRGTVDSVVAPTPVVDSSSNLDRMPMLTYQPDGAAYPLWPYDALQSIGTVAWLVILIVGITQAVRASATGPAILVLAVWCAWNWLFHTIWGDEYFLYTPHYAWAFLTAAMIGWQSLPKPLLAALVLPVVAASIATLMRYRWLILAIEA